MPKNREIYKLEPGECFVKINTTGDAVTSSRYMKINLPDRTGVSSPKVAAVILYTEDVSKHIGLVELFESKTVVCPFVGSFVVDFHATTQKYST